MKHPFFNAASYPHSLPEGRGLYEVLVGLVEEQKRIDLLYETCGSGLPPLDLGQAPDLVWRDALDNLTKSGLLEKLLETLATEHTRHGPLQQAILQVRNAKPVSLGGRLLNTIKEKRGCTFSVSIGFALALLSSLPLLRHVSMNAPPPGSGISQTEWHYVSASAQLAKELNLDHEELALELKVPANLEWSQSSQPAFMNGQIKVTTGDLPKAGVQVILESGKDGSQTQLLTSDADGNIRFTLDKKLVKEELVLKLPGFDKSVDIALPETSAPLSDPFVPASGPEMQTPRGPGIHVRPK